MKREGKVVLLFGSFNPPTNAHMQMADTAQEEYENSSVYFIPAVDKYLTEVKHPNHFVLSQDRRAVLLNTECKKGQYVSVLPYEKTYDVVESIKSLLLIKNSDIVLCFGDDILSDISNWYRAEDLIRENHFLILSRVKPSVLPDLVVNYKDNFRFKNFVLFEDVSSTRVREAYANDDLDSVRHMIPYRVYQFLKNYNVRSVRNGKE